MIGALNNFQADLDALNFHFDAELFDEQLQKDFYKLSRNYKIAWNWKKQKDINFPFWERNVEDRRKRAVYELVRSYDDSFLIDLYDRNFSTFIDAGVLSTASYWLNGGTFYIEYYETALSTGQDIVFGTNADGDQKSYRDSLQIELAIRRLIRKCSKWQREDKDSFRPELTLIFGIEKNTNVLYLNLIAER